MARGRLGINWRLMDLNDLSPATVFETLAYGPSKATNILEGIRLPV